MINWNDGLSVGVETLDNDHKKLLEIINHLSEAIDRDEQRGAFEVIFKDLEDYVKKHFYKEESFLKKCEYEDFEDHKKQHLEFANKIPELREKFFSADNYIDAKDISVFLTDWLINHIINEDMKFIGAFEKCGINEKKNSGKSWFTKLIKEATSTVSFTKRMLFSALIPLFGMMILGSIIVLNDYKEYKKVDAISKITNIVVDVNDVSHALQIERGLSSGHLLAKSDKFSDKLNKQRELVDKVQELLINKVETISSKKISLIIPYIEIVKTDISALHNIRKMIDNKTISKIQVIDFYSKMIENILNITTKVMLINTNRDITYSISTLSAILNMKEVLGLQRAEGTILIEQKGHTNEEYKAFVELLGAQKTFYSTFEQTASQNHKSIVKRILSTPVASQISNYKKKILNSEYQDLDSKVWFELTTEHINDIKQFIDHHLDETNILINSNLDDAINNLKLWLLYTVLFVLITRFMIYIFEKSTKEQIFQLTDAMKHLALGGRTLRLTSKNSRDEISQIYDAYEATRQKLLKGDIFTQLYLSQEKVKFDNQKRENLKLEEMAFIDPLTGTINRRKFEELSTLELERTMRYKHSLSFLMLDIDHFKSVNDTYGHAVGDEVIKRFAHICKDMARNLDIVARIGGEEFVIMLPETNRDGAYLFAQRLREIVSSTSVTIEGKEINYTVSIGVSVFDIDKDKDVKSVLWRADKALYEAKNSGRNTTVVF